MPSAEAVLDRVDPAARGIALLALGRPADALAVLRAVVAAGDATPVTRLNLALAEDRVGDRECARRQMQGIADLLPDWDEPKLRLAESLRTDATRRIDARLGADTT
jgi:Flp pilus assembly protein TadD